jgi:hypothetical protein
MPDAEVKARLSIEQDGQPQIFRDAATAIGDLANTLQSIQSAGAGAFGPLLAQLDQIISKANDAATALKQLNQP